MDFDAALAYLDSHINLEAMADGPKAGAVHGLSLARMQGIVGVLGDPQDSAPVIQVTGTNGKGSVARMVAALLGAHGLTVGVYGSPHLESVTERIRRNAEDISRSEFAAVVGELARLEPLFPDRPSFFDLLTAAALAWFAQEAVEVMVLEVGMLGRYDSTNVAHADVAVVTNVGRDHTDGVGDWRRAVAWEKAGIIGERSAVVIGETDPALVPIFEGEGGSLHWVRDRHFGVRSSSVAVGGRNCALYTPASRHDGLFVPLHGPHQADNAAVAVAAAEAFFGRPLAPEVVAEALASVRAPGRFEVIGRSPLVVVDMAHNPDGARAVAETLRSEFEPAGELRLVVGLLRGRDPAETLRPLVELDPVEVWCTQAESPRSVPAGQVAEAVVGLVGGGRSRVRVEPDVAGAVGRCLESAGSEDAVLVAGSTYVAGAARSALRRLGVLAGPVA